MNTAGSLPGEDSGKGVKLTTHLTTSVEVKNTWRYTSIHPYVFMAWYLIKRRDNFTLYRVWYADS
jgi:hypothetical protein